MDLPPYLSELIIPSTIWKEVTVSAGGGFYCTFPLQKKLPVMSVSSLD